jgi:hypothetical protein
MTPASSLSLSQLHWLERRQQQPQQQRPQRLPQGLWTCLMRPSQRRLLLQQWQRQLLSPMLLLPCHMEAAHVAAACPLIWSLPSSNPAALPENRFLGML